MSDSRPTVAIIGASSDRTKFGNKAVRAFLQQDYDVFPVNPREKEIEGIKCYASLADIPAKLDMVSIYVPPAVALKALEDVAKKGAREVWLNPGTESDDVIEKATELKLHVITDCSIMAIGVDPESI
ncbi:CoA-binding protein [Oscillatoria amoena NRMC-F 0135]|nr:CoA-binding protein [Oscillatoria amoena NRMC-F 0135]